MEEVKKCLNSKSNAAGEIEKEILEIKQLQQENVEGIHTITVGCSGAFTLICC